MNASILIGICTSNDDKTLDGLLEQCFHAKFTYGQSNSGIQIDQIIVVSSGSTDQSNMILDQYKTTYSEFLWNDFFIFGWLRNTKTVKHGS